METLMPVLQRIAGFWPWHGVGVIEIAVKIDQPNEPAHTRILGSALKSVVPLIASFVSFFHDCFPETICLR